MSIVVNYVFLISFLDLFAVSSTVPLIASHVKSLGASHLLVGLGSSIYAVSQFVSGPIAGSWSDVKGRQPILLCSMLLCSLSYYLLGFTNNVVGFILIRMLLGITKHTQSLCKATLSDVVSKEEQTKMLGRYNSISGIGFIVGPVIGGHLAELKHGFYYVCSITSLLFLINASIVFMFLPTIKKKTSRRERRKQLPKNSIMMAISQLQSINWSLYWDLFSIKFLLAFSIAIFFSNYSLTIQERFNISPSAVGYTISFQSILGAISSFGAGTIRRMYTEEPAKLTYHGFMALGLSFFFLAICFSVSSFLIALVPLAVVSAILRVALSQWSLDKAPPTKKGSVLGAQHSLSAVARMTAPVISGFAQSAVGSKGPCLVSLLFSIIGVTVSAAVLNKQRPRKYSGSGTDSSDYYEYD